MDKPKFCVDCKWCVSKFWDPIEYAKCLKVPNIVSGKAEAYCEVERKCGGCGLDGKHWEPKDEA